MHAYAILSAVGDLILAAPSPTPQPIPKTIPEVIDGLKRWIMGILLAMATLFWVIGALRYVAASEPADTERAKGNFKTALAGYALAVLAPVILQVLHDILTD